MYDISQLKDGIFGFIPDATMIGTVFINSIAYIMDNKQISLNLFEETAIKKFIHFISINDLNNFMHFLKIL